MGRSMPIVRSVLAVEKSKARKLAIAAITPVHPAQQKLNGEGKERPPNNVQRVSALRGKLEMIVTARALIEQV